MKILKLEFKNLNSLKGEWRIDFTDPAYANDGLFAIIGPTGAGKTTILDAICLSLYGRTPRLNNSITNSSNEIMNRTSLDCFAQTTFSCESGEIRSSFEQRYSNGKNGVRLQSLKMRYENLTTGEELSGSKAVISEIIAQKTGLKYDQFTRAVLLAQGQFKEFLDAKANDRSELLETITGTQIYSDVSQKISERYSVENDALKALGNQLEAIELLTDQQLKEKEKEAEDFKVKSENFRKEMELLSQQLEWVKNVNVAKKEFAAVEQNIANNEKELKNFEPQRFQLLRDEKARKIETDFNITKQNKEYLDKLDSQIADYEKRINVLNKKKEGSVKGAQDAQTKLELAQAELEKQKPIIEKVKRLDAIISEKKNDIQPEQTAFETLQRKYIHSCRQAGVSPDSLSDKLTTDEIESQISKLLGGISIAETNDNVKRFILLKSAWEKLLSVKKPFFENKSSIKKAKEDIEQYNQNIGDLNNKKQRLESAKKDAEDKQELLQEKIKISNEIKSLEEYREKLVEGKPCPLCGAESHPYCQNGVALTLSEDEKQLEETKKQVRKLHQDFTKAAEDLAKAEAQKAQAEKSISDLTEKNKLLEAQFIPICKNEIGCDDDVTVGEIEFRIRRIEIKTAQTSKNLKSAEEMDALKDPVQIRGELNEQKRKLKLKEDELNKQTDERQTLFSNSDPDRTLALLVSDVDRARNQLQENNVAAAAAETELKSTKRILEAMQEERKSKLNTYNDSVTAFNKKLEDEQFSSVNDFLAAGLSDSQREEYQKIQKELNEQKARLEGQRSQIKEKLSKLEQTPLSDKPEDELEQRSAALKEQRDELIRQIGAVAQQLAENERRKKQSARVQTEYEQKKAVVDQWRNLNNLIGSADGKKYRRIVQRISLETLIDYANDQMALLAPRYQLTLQQSDDERSESEDQTSNVIKTTVVSAKDALSIFCIDTWQGRAVRPTTNLSGGESFLVSLALALGLSKMSSHNRSLETLFLDEGFGSLDEDTLQTALDAINQFQHSDDTNKLVGIISHVDALKERIANKIEVARSAAGASVLSGPGVTRISKVD